MSATIRSMSECRLVLCVEEERQEMYGAMIIKKKHQVGEDVYINIETFCAHMFVMQFSSGHFSCYHDICG
jgi:hypothetical protein